MWYIVLTVWILCILISITLILLCVFLNITRQRNFKSSQSLLFDAFRVTFSVISLIMISILHTVKTDILVGYILKSIVFFTIPFFYIPDLLFSIKLYVKSKYIYTKAKVSLIIKHMISEKKIKFINKVVDKSESEINLSHLSPKSSNISNTLNPINPIIKSPRFSMNGISYFSFKIISKFLFDRSIILESVILQVLISIIWIIFSSTCFIIDEFTNYIRPLVAEIIFTSCLKTTIVVVLILSSVLLSISNDTITKVLFVLFILLHIGIIIISLSLDLLTIMGIITNMDISWSLTSASIIIACETSIRLIVLIIQNSRRDTKYNYDDITSLVYDDDSFKVLFNHAKSEVNVEQITFMRYCRKIMLLYNKDSGNVKRLRSELEIVSDLYFHQTSPLYLNLPSSHFVYITRIKDYIDNRTVNFPKSAIFSIVSLVAYDAQDLIYRFKKTEEYKSLIEKQIITIKID